MANEKEPIDNEGEGSKTADRNYREGVKTFLENEDPEKLARDAERDVESDEASYRKAEQEGKRRIAEEDPEDKNLI